VIIKTEDFKDKLMLEMLGILTDAQIQVLITEKDCFLKLAAEEE